MVVYVSDAAEPSAIAEGAFGAAKIVSVEPAAALDAIAAAGADVVAIEAAAADTQWLEAIRRLAPNATLIAAGVAAPGVLCAADSASLPALVRLAVEAARLRAQARTGDERWRRLADAASDAVIVHAQGRIRWVNGAAAQWLGEAPPAFVGRAVDEVVAPAGRFDQDDAAALRFAPGRLLRRDGSLVEVEIAADTGCFGGVAAVELVARRVPSRSAGRAERRDRLTSLPGRGEFRERLAAALARAHRGGRKAAVLVVDIDRFQAVNAAVGQAGGDLVLQRLAERLQRGTRQGDTVARLAGDQFGLALEALDDRNGAALAAERVRGALAQPVDLPSGRIEPTASIGLAVYPDDGSDADALWQRAELAVRHAKEGGRNTWRAYSAELDSRARRDALRRAEIARRSARLTPREREVMELLVTGKANKMVAYLLGTAPRTVEKHRASIMEKMEADSLAELVRMAMEAG